MPQETDCLWYSFPKAALFGTNRHYFWEKILVKNTWNYAFPEDFELKSWSYSDSTMKNSLEKRVLIGFVTNEFFMKIYDYKHKGGPLHF